MDELNREFLKVYFDRYRVPSVLYQYTNFAGLEGILKSRKFWATDTHFLNDSSEITYADQMMSTILNDRMTTIAGNSILQDIYYDVLGRKYGLPSVIRAWDDDFYVVSFSQDGNLLSQWRAYGADGAGYAIGIRPHDLEEKIEGATALAYGKRGLAFIKVCYDEDEQRALILDVVDRGEEIIKDEYRSRTESEHKSFCETAAKALSTIMWQFVVFLKHPDFREENEWRVVKKRWGANAMPGINDGAKKGVKYRTRASDNARISYLELDFASRDDAQLIPIEEIRLGPRLRDPDAQEKLKEILLSLGYGTNMPKTPISGTPYR